MILWFGFCVVSYDRGTEHTGTKALCFDFAHFVVGRSTQARLCYGEFRVIKIRRLPEVCYAQFSWALGPHIFQ